MGLGSFSKGVKGCSSGLMSVENSNGVSERRPGRRRRGLKVHEAGKSCRGGGHRYVQGEVGIREGIE
jgi:hypothetical protein